MNPDVEASLFPRSKSHTAPAELHAATPVLVKKAVGVKKTTTTSPVAPNKPGTAASNRR